MDGNVLMDDADPPAPIERQVVVHEDVTETVTEDVEGTVRSRFAAGAAATFTTFSSQTGDDATLIYFTPVFNGFQFGVSYAPNNSEARPGGVYLLPDEAATDHGEVYSVGGRYDGSVGDLGVTVAAGWYSAENKVDSNDGLALDTASAWNAGLVLYWDNWSLGGSYNQIDNLRNVRDTDQATYDIGLAYSSDGAWSAGIYWLNSEIDYAAGTLVPVAVTDEMDSYRFMVSYDLGPGIGVTGAVGYDEFQDGVTERDYETQFVGAGIMIGF
jgi:predicted porin